MELFEQKGAEFSEDKTRRFSLWRIWDKTKPMVMFIGLNPSTTNYETDDPTIESVRRISTTNGYGGFYMTNLFTIISSNPDILKDKKQLSGFIHDVGVLYNVRQKCYSVVFAWGNFKEANGRGNEVKKYFTNALCIGKNKNGSPKHPLFQKGNIILSNF